MVITNVLQLQIPEPEAVDVVDVEPPMVDIEPSKEIAAGKAK
jgi:hypothetical protein